jgi:hypothetical protein
MFTFCFTSLAAAQMRRTRETRKTTRKTTDAMRAVRIGLASLTVLAWAGMAQAHGPSIHPASSGSSHNNGGSNLFSQSNQFKMNQTNNALKVQKPITATNTLNTQTTTKVINTTTGTGIALNNNAKPNKLFSGNSSPNSSSCCHKCCHCCSWWNCWNYPCWCPLYSCGCGCWYDVPVVEVQGLDLQLLAVRTIDGGDAEKQLGPAMRVWFRNNSSVAITHPFNVLALAARDIQPTADLPQAGVRVDSIDAGQTVSVDIRLPVMANQPGFPFFHVLVDSDREIPEVDENNNGLVIKRLQVQPVEVAQATSGGNTSATTQPTPPTTSDTPPAPPTTTDTAETTTTDKSANNPPAPPSDSDKSANNPPAPPTTSDTPDSTDTDNSTVPLMMRGVHAE